MPVAVVLLVFGLAGPGTANALQFDSFSLSAFVEPIGGGPRSVATFTATAQDFSLGIGFIDQSFFTTFQTVRLGCFGSDGFIPIPCRPGASVSAGAHASLSVDVHASMVLGGQSIPGCDNNHHPLGDLEGTLCVTASVLGLGWGSALLPPFAGAPAGHSVPDVPADILNVTTVASTFAVSGVGATIWQSGPGTAPRPIDGIGFGGDEFHFDPLTGPAQFDLEWQPDTGTWLPLFAEGRIDVTVTPEPATLLLLATPGAGLGLIRQYRRRGDKHAA